VAYFRHLSEDADPRLLLDPKQQVSTPWGRSDKGPCDKCRGNGPIPFRCLSCVELGSRTDCPACGGRVEYVDVCPTCAGTGEISNTRRPGVSAFPTLAGLYRYLVERDFDFAGSVIVELEGTPSEQPDLDADCGALLVHPQEIVTRHAVDLDRVSDLSRRLSVAARDR